MTANDELHIRLEQKPEPDPNAGAGVLPGPARLTDPTKEPESRRVYRRMSEVIKVIEPSAISAHHKGETLRLLERLRDEEVLRLVAREAQR